MASKRPNLATLGWSSGRPVKVARHYEKHGYEINTLKQIILIWQKTLTLCKLHVTSRHVQEEELKDYEIFYLLFLKKSWGYSYMGKMVQQTMLLRLDNMTLLLLCFIQTKDGERCAALVDSRKKFASK